MCCHVLCYYKEITEIMRKFFNHVTKMLLECIAVGQLLSLRLALVTYVYLHFLPDGKGSNEVKRKML